MFPPVLWLTLRHKSWVMLGSVLLYLAARHYGWNFPSYPSGVWYFNPFTWQLLFLLGAWLALGRIIALDFLLQSRVVLCLSIVFLLFALVMTLSVQITELQSVIPTVLFEAFNPNDKTNLAPYRVIHLAILVLLVARLIPVDWPGLGWPIFRPLIKCGQQSLEVFCVGVFLSLIAHFILEKVSGGYLAQLLVGAAGLAIMTGVAYYRSWSKQVDKPIAADLNCTIQAGNRRR
ncbi:OpgC domain-containing protein, partial [Bradyrhizobium sp.]|uniref:OpgC domain-containing protein n=1 Tax=Bradyrhizobium sp. TaxID=376 RepID=UPI003C73A55B